MTHSLPETPDAAPPSSLPGSSRDSSGPSPGARPPRGGWGLLVAALVGAAAGGTGVWARMSHQHPGEVPARSSASAGSAAGAAQAPAAPLYQCPMHPSITSDHPGDCPICGMKLVLVQAEPTTETKTPAARRVAFYRSPMDPKQTSPVFRKDEMGMDFLPVYADELAGSAGQSPGSARRPGEKLQGLATITIDPARQQMIGLRTAPATRGPVSDTWRTVGRVEVDPTRVRKVNVKFEGYVERTFAGFVGQKVSKGQPLFSLYSPSLLAAQNEYLLALSTRRQLAAATSLASNGDDLVNAARRKLELWDISDAEIARLEKTGVASKTITLSSPTSGVVTAKNIVEGSRVNPGDTPYEITDLSMVWVMADAYETDLAHARVGAKATMTLKPLPGVSFTGRVQFVDPVIDPKTRTTKVHLHFANKTGELKPDMYGEVELEGKTTMGLQVPSDAIIHAGTKDIVFVALGDGKFAPREIRGGVQGAGSTQILSGLSDGETVVSRANFLIDSESRLRASLAAIGLK